MSAGYTPGPYRAGKYSSMLGCPVMAQPDPSENSIVICSVYGGMSDDDRARSGECEATARLLAAAPELLEALRASVDRCFDPGCPMCAEHEALIAKVTAA